MGHRQQRPALHLTPWPASTCERRACSREGAQRTVRPSAHGPALAYPEGQPDAARPRPQPARRSRKCGTQLNEAGEPIQTGVPSTAAVHLRHESSQMHVLQLWAYAGQWRRGSATVGWEGGQAAAITRRLVLSGPPTR